MLKMRRSAVVPALVLTLAACAAPGGGAGTNQPAPSTGSPSASASAAAEAPGERVDVASLARDPGSFEGKQISILARVDENIVDGAAFLTSPSASDQDQVLVVVRPDAMVDKEPAVGSVLWVDGTVVNFTPEDLQSAGIDLTADDLGGFDGEFLFVADAVRDPLAGA